MNDWQMLLDGFGWDWSRGIVPTGITDSVILSSYRTHFLAGQYVRFDGSSASLELEIESRFGGEDVIPWRLTPCGFEGQSASGNFRLSLKPGNNGAPCQAPLCGCAGQNRHLQRQRFGACTRRIPEHPLFGTAGKSGRFNRFCMEYEADAIFIRQNSLSKKERRSMTE